MAYANTKITYEGGDKVFLIPFPYVSTKDIYVFVNDPNTTNFTIANNSIYLNDELTPGDVVSIYRMTQKDKLEVLFSEGAGLTSDNMDIVNEQLLFIVQEAMDGLTATMGEGSDGNWDADNKTINNLPAPVADTDIVRKMDITPLAVDGVTELQTKMNTAETDINTLEVDVSNLSNALTSNVSALTTDIQTNTDAINNITTNPANKKTGCVNSGSIVDGQGDILDEVDSNNVTLVATSTPINGTYYNGKGFTISVDTALSVPLSTATYKVLVDGVDGVVLFNGQKEKLSVNMTGSALPSGEQAWCNNNLGSNAAVYRAFDGVDDSWFITENANPSVSDPHIILRKMTANKAIDIVGIGEMNSDSDHILDFKIVSTTDDMGSYSEIDASLVNISFTEHKVVTGATANITDIVEYALDTKIPLNATAWGIVITAVGTGSASAYTRIARVEGYAKAKTITTNSTGERPDIATSVDGDRYIDRLNDTCYVVVDNGGTLEWNERQFTEIAEIEKVDGAITDKITYWYNGLAILDVTTTSGTAKEIENKFRTSNISVQIKENNVIQNSEPTVTEDTISWIPSYTGTSVITIVRLD